MAATNSGKRYRIEVTLTSDEDEAHIKDWFQALLAWSSSTPVQKETEAVVEVKTIDSSNGTRLSRRNPDIVRPPTGDWEHYRVQIPGLPEGPKGSVPVQDEDFDPEELKRILAGQEDRDEN